MPQLIFKLLLSSFLFTAALSGFAEPLPPAVEDFIESFDQEPDIDKADVKTLMEKAQYRQDILDRMQGRAEKKSWYQYRPIFIKPERIQLGIAFWATYKDLLEKAEKDFGVDAAIIVAILGVETYYGKRSGDIPVLDALYTLGFHHPKRAKFFRSELKHFILLSKSAGFDPTQVTGSYAGAMGASQFISSSYRHYAIDYDKDGRIDLWNSPADIIGSVANYFAKHHWIKGESVAIKVAGVDPKKHRALFFSDQDRLLKEVVKPKDKPNQPLTKVLEAGIRPLEKIPDQALAYLMPFEVSKHHYDFWLGFHNFYVITRYNRSPLYAMAVFQLSQEIEQRRPHE
jgi:membrane-bound lytic murein transglycosylase B